MSRVFDALSHVTACSDHSAARAASAKRLCRMCPASTFQRQSLQPHGEWIQVVSECAESMAVMQLSTLLLYASDARPAPVSDAICVAFRAIRLRLGAPLAHARDVLLMSA